MNIVTLSNGKRVANFSSPHEFVFEDGSVLPAVDALEAKRLEVTFVEIDMGSGDLSLTFRLSQAVADSMYEWTHKWLEGAVDVVFCCQPMMEALKSMGFATKLSPFRSIRIEDRIKKLVSIHKQCI